MQDVDVDLQLAPPDEPGFSRRPDVIVVHRSALDRVDRVDREGGMLRASEVVVAVEFLSPGSRRTDQVIKRAEYADAGIPHYWIVDLDDPVSLIDRHLADERAGRSSGGYSGGGAPRGSPFAVEIDLDTLR